jgi:hypothetical protein
VEKTDSIEAEALDEENDTPELSALSNAMG